MKRLLLVVLLLILLSACTNETTNQGDDIMIQQNCKPNTSTKQLTQTKTLDAKTLWQYAEVCEGLQYIDGEIMLQESIEEATYKSSVFLVPDYVELVPTWNISLDNDSIMRIRVKVGTDDQISEPFLMAYWTTSYKFSLRNQTDDLANVYIDTIVANDTVFNRVQFEVEFRSGNPKLQALSYTTKPHNEVRQLEVDSINDIALDVPAKQQLSIPTIGSSICSPTSLSMVLSYYDIPQTPTDTAYIVFDEGASIYGNWSFNASYAGSFPSLQSRVEYISNINVLFGYLHQGIPVIMSIKTTDISQLEGTIMAYPAGHLIVLTGIHTQDGVLYATVNDPAEHIDENVSRSYKLSQLLQVWNGYSYIIEQIDDN